MSEAIRKSCMKALERQSAVPVSFNDDPDNPDVREVPVGKENRLVFVNVYEWAAALKKADPKTDEDREMIRDFKQGLAGAGDPRKIPGQQVGVQALQALAVLDMAATEKLLTPAESEALAE